MKTARANTPSVWANTVASVCLHLLGACGPMEGADYDLGDTSVEDGGLSGAVEEKAAKGLLAKPVGTKLRLASYNVLRDSVFDGARKDAFARIAPAVDADVWCMQEVSYGEGPAPTSEGNKWRDRMQQITGQTWHYAWDRVGRYLLSRNPITWNKVLGQRVHASWIDAKNLVVINVHLAPGGADRDQTRQNQATKAKEFIRDVKDGGYQTSAGRITSDATIVVCGDFNAGLGSKPYNILRVDNTLNDVYPKHLAAQHLTATHGTVKFSDGRASMDGGPIDFVLTTGSLKPAADFVLNTLVLNSTQLSQAGGLKKTDVAVKPSDAVNATNGSSTVDHLPIVVDFK